MVGLATDEQRLIEAALALAAESGWQRTSVAAAALRGGVDLVAAYDTFPDKRALLAGIMARVDRRVLADGAAAAEDSPRDRLFEILMRRFDALQEDRDAMAALLRGLPVDPLAVVSSAPALFRSMAWILEAAGLSSQGIVGFARIKAVTLIYLAALKVWLDDDSPDMARTMATLDRGLREAEGLARRCPWLTHTEGDALPPQPDAAAAATAGQGAAAGSATTEPA